MGLTSLTLPIGSSDNRLTLTQTQVNTLISVYYDTGITTKNVSGYVYKASLKRREYYLLTQLRLNVAYGTLTDDMWGITSAKSLLNSGESTTFAATGEVTTADLVLELGSCAVEYGQIDAEDLQDCFTLAGGSLSFDKGSIPTDFTAKAVVRAHPVWNASDIKEVEVGAVSVSSIRTVFINPASLSAQLEYEGSLALVNDYISKCKCYVFNSPGTRKAEIASATFEGNYSGMTAGSVTFKDGTVVTLSALLQRGANFMVLRPDMHIFSGMNSNLDEILQCTGAFHVKEGKMFPKKYIGMFKAYNDGGILKSQPGRIPTGAQTIAVFQTQAMNGGRGYGLWNYSDWCKENALHLSYFAYTNYEQNVGVGRINNYNNVRNIVTGFTLPLVGQHNCGAVATVDSQGNAVNCLNFFGIEGLGEQIWEFVIGFRHDGNTAYIWDENSWNENHSADRTFPMAVKSASGTYIKTVIAGEHFDMLPKSVGASATTGMCDGHWYASSGRLLFVGGHAGNGSICGLSASAADSGFSSSNADFGARLAFYGEPETVSGSELFA